MRDIDDVQTFDRGSTVPPASINVPPLVSVLNYNRTILKLSDTKRRVAITYDAAGSHGPSQFKTRPTTSAQRLRI